jgi:flavin-binding protein dodecin
LAVTKIIEVVGSSPESSDGAVQAALNDARQTLRNIKAVDVVSLMGTVAGIVVRRVPLLRERLRIDGRLGQRSRRLRVVGLRLVLGGDVLRRGKLKEGLDDGGVVDVVEVRHDGREEERYGGVV